MSGARLLIVLSSLALLAVACPGDAGTSAAVRFRVEPAGAATVTLWDVGKGLERHATAATTVTLEAPRDQLQEPRITIESADGAETTSPKLSISAVTTLVDVGRMRIWPAVVGVQHAGDRYRFSWAALDGEEVPATVHYSLLFTYRNVHGEDDEGTLLAKEKLEAVVTLAELSEIFPGRDPKAKTMKIRIRAYAGAGPAGQIWAGPRKDWTAPDDLPAPPPGAK